MKTLTKFYEAVMKTNPGDFRARKWASGTWAFIVGVLVGLMVGIYCI